MLESITVSQITRLAEFHDLEGQIWGQIQDGRRKYDVFFNSVKTIALRPQICMKHEYKLEYCGHFDV